MKSFAFQGRSNVHPGTRAASQECSINWD